MSQFRKKNVRSTLTRVASLYYCMKLGVRNVSFDLVVHLMRFPKNISINTGAYVKWGAMLCPCNENAKIIIGSNTTIGYHTKIFASELIEIGENCMIAPNVYIVDSDHGIERGYLMNEQPNQTKPIVIGNDVWIGAGVTVLKGVRIAKGSVIAAHAVVTKDTSPYSINAGVPAKQVGERK